MKSRIAIPLFLLIAAGLLLSFLYARRSDSLRYEIYELRNDSRQLLAKGTVQSDGKAVTSIECSAFGQSFWQKSVPLAEDIAVGASIFRENELGGSGLWIEKDASGFSWNWFTRESGQIYRKLQGDGRVRAIVAQKNDDEELEGVEFLDDVTLTGKLGWFGAWGGDTHCVVIKKGSVLRLAP